MKFSQNVLFALLGSTVLMGSSSFAASRALSGDYALAQDCQITTQALGTVSIPAGSVVVSENIPVSNDDGTESPAIIFQAAGSFQSVLSLKNGKVFVFRFGPEPFTSGSYSSNGKTYEEQYSDGGPNPTIDSTITVTKTSTGLKLTAVEQSPSQTTTCDFTSAP